MFLGKRSNGIFFIEYFDPTILKNRRVSTGTNNKSQALHFLRSFNSNITVTSDKPKLKLSLFETEYNNTIGKNLSKDYQRSIQLAFRQIISSIGDIPIQDITTRLAQCFISETYSRAKDAAELYHRTLKAAFSRAVSWEYIDENPFKKIKLPKRIRKFPKFISDVELTSIIENTSNQLLKKVFFFGFYTGMRLGEIVNLKWSSVNLEERIIQIQNSSDFTLKGKKDRVVPICEKLYQMLNKIFINSAIDKRYVFEKCLGIPIHRNYVSKSFKSAVRASNLDDGIHFHSLRHSFASNLIQRGASIYVLKELLGHEDISTTQIYSHLKRESLTNAISLLD